MRILLSVLASSLALAFPPLAIDVQAAPAIVSKGAAASRNTFSRSAALPAWADPLLEIPATGRKDPVVIRLAQTQALVGASEAVLVNRAIQVNQQSALGVIGQFGIDFFPAYQKLQLHRVAILRGKQTMDRTAKVNTRLLERETAIDAGMYGGAMTLQLLLDDVRVGDTLWITYSTEGSNPVFGKQWSGDFSWDSSVPLERRSLTVFHPYERPVYWRQLGDFRTTPLTPLVSRQGQIEKLQFDERALDAIESEESVPADYAPGRSLQLSEYRDWNGVAIWADGLFPHAAATPALKALAAQMRKQPTPGAQASAALRWVQDEIRYFSVSIGENSHRPQAPETVLKLRYGDCKDKSYLLVSLLNQLGIQARLVLLNARAPKSPARIIASPSWFDHVIVQLQVDGHTYYVDPTASGQKLALDKLATVFAGASGLVVDPATQGLTILPEELDVGPEYEHLDRISIASFDGDAVLETRETYRGAYAQAMRTAIPALSSTEFAKNMLERYENLYPGVTLTEPPRMEDDSAANVFAILGRYKLPKPVRQTDDGYAIDYDSHILAGSLGLPKKIVRNYPLALPWGKYASRYRLEIQWPASVRVNQEATTKVIDNPFFSARGEFSLKGNVIDYMLDYRVKQAIVPAAEVPALQVQSKLLEPYVVSAFGIVKDAVDKPALTAMSLSMRERDVVEVAGNTHSVLDDIDVSKATSKTMDKACDMLIGGYRLRDLVSADTKDMVAETEQMLRKDHAASSVLCLARLSYARSAFAESVALFQRAELKEDSPYRRELAWAQAYAGDDSGALATMSAYRLARRDAGISIAAGLELADEISLAQRAHQPVPAEVMQFAREIPDGIWPRPLLAMQAGVLSAESLLKLIGSYPADKRDLALNDSWFYIGQQRLQAGDMLAARRAFLWYGVDGLRSSVQYERAKMEMDKLIQRDENYYLGQAAFNRGDYAVAIEKWRASANAGFSAGQYEMGTLYFGGKYLPQDYQLARYWFELVAAKGDEAGMNGLAAIYRDGDGVAVDKATAIKWYAKAAEAGSANSAYNLALSYQDGDGIEKDLQQAFIYMRQAAENNIVQAQGRLAIYYLSDEHLDEPKALRWASRAAAQDDEVGIMTLANIYSYGRGVQEDKARAFGLYQKAAADGSLAAMNNLADMYEKGKGVAQDYAKALSLYRQAARQGQRTALISLSGLYEQGLGVQADPVLSYTYCKLSLHADNEKVAEHCKALSTVLSADKIAAADALALAWKPGMPLPLPASF